MTIRKRVLIDFLAKLLRQDVEHAQVWSHTLATELRGFLHRVEIHSFQIVWYDSLEYVLNSCPYVMKMLSID